MILMFALDAYRRSIVDLMWVWDCATNLIGVLLIR